MLRTKSPIHSPQTKAPSTSEQEPSIPTTENRVASDMEPQYRLGKSLDPLHGITPKLHIPTPRKRAHLAASSTASSQNFTQELEEITNGLLFISETDLPYTVFKQSFDNEELNPETFRQALSVSSGTEVSTRSIEEFFHLYQEFYDFPAGSDEPQKYQALEEILRANLTQLQVIYVGGENVVEGDVYIVGLNNDGQIEGLKTGRVWT